MALTAEELEHHKRHILLKEIGGPGVQRLRDAHVAIIGAGALGGPCAMYLAAAGVGKIEIWDDDVVDRSNLQRQIQFDTATLGQSKAAVLGDRLRAINPALDIVVHPERFTAKHTVPGDVLIDATDNFPSRYAINASAHKSGRPMVMGAAARWSGQVAIFASGYVADAPCYQCFVPEMPPEAEACDDVGVVGAVTGIVATQMALETVKLITGAGQTLIGRVTILDGLTGQTRTLGLRPNRNCPICQP